MKDCDDREEDSSLLNVGTDLAGDAGPVPKPFDFAPGNPLWNDTFRSAERLPKKER
jgi:hypothetical protein